MAELRPLQQAALGKLRETLLTGSKRPVIQAPCGFGKTVLAAAIVQGALAKNRRVTFCVPLISLIDQSFERFVENGIDPGDIGVIQADHEWRRAQAPVQIASIQTIGRRGFPLTDFVVVDECHIQFEALARWMGDDAKRIFIGLSATPWARGMGKLWDRLIVAATARELIEAGCLSRFRIFAPSHPDLSGIKTVAGDYHEGQLAERMSQPTLVADVVATWLDKADGRPTLVFAVNRAHAALIHEQFSQAGIASAYVDAFTPRDERVALGKSFDRGELKVICSVGTMGTGVDLDVRCIVNARPTKSEIRWVQDIGRGLRTAAGKELCVARDTLVLTDKGEVKIQDITCDQKVWDGKNFVSHEGAICKGIQSVITYDGVTATPEHKVMTHEGWMQISQAARRHLRIVRTGFGGLPIRVADNHLSQDGGHGIWAACGSEVRSLFRCAYGALPQYQEKARYSRMPALQWAETSHGSALVISTLSGSAGTVPKSVCGLILSIWRPWDRISFRWTERSRKMDCGEYWYSRSLNGDRQNQQRRSLRAWEFALGPSGAKCEQQQHFSWWARTVYRLSAAISACTICRQDSPSTDLCEADGRADYREMECSIKQAKREVWDILNAGPLQRFTANGRLVHNCLILDHSDTALRLGLPTDIHHSELDDGERQNSDRFRAEKSVPLPKECPACTCLVPPGSRECPHCGLVAKRNSNVVTVEGELTEIGAKSRTKNESVKARLVKMGRAEIFGQIKTIGRERGWSAGRQAHCYREIFDCWPNGQKDAPERPPSFELLSWIRARNIAFAKSRKRESSHAA